MQLPQREGIQIAIIAVWGKIQLTQLDLRDRRSSRAGESPRKGLLIDYLGNLRQSAQLGLPVYSITAAQAISGQPVLTELIAAISAPWRLTLPHYLSNSCIRRTSSRAVARQNPSKERNRDDREGK